MKKSPKIITAPITVLIIALAAISVITAIINTGVPAFYIETEARKSQHIDESNAVAADISEDMAAMLFYPEDLSDTTFSIYVNRPGWDFGYHFVEGGAVASIDYGIALFAHYGDRAFISANTQKVSRAKIIGINSESTITLDSNKPFCFIVEDETAIVEFYDVNNKLIEYETSII